MKFNKKEKLFFDRIRKGFLSLSENFMISTNTIFSVIGFILAQFVWIWILKGFLGWFGLWFCEVTNYSIINILKLTKVFWVIYGIWFFVCILNRFRIVGLGVDEE